MGEAWPWVSDRWRGFIYCRRWGTRGSRGATTSFRPLARIHLLSTHACTPVNVVGLDVSDRWRGFIYCRRGVSPSICQGNTAFPTAGADSFTVDLACYCCALCARFGFRPLTRIHLLSTVCAI